MPIIRVTDELLSPKLKSGEANTNYLTALSVVARSGLPRVTDSELNVELSPDATELAVADVAALVTAGAEVYEYPAFVKIPIAKLAETVPEGIPGALDAQGEKVTWEKWGHATITASKTDALKEAVASGSYLKGSELKQLIDAGFEVVSRKEARILVAEAQAEIKPIPVPGPEEPIEG